jgi:hypothetical protein
MANSHKFGHWDHKVNQHTNALVSWSFGDKNNSWSPCRNNIKGCIGLQGRRSSSACEDIFAGATGVVGWETIGVALGEMIHKWQWGNALIHKLLHFQLATIQPFDGPPKQKVGCETCVASGMTHSANPTVANAQETSHHW